MATKDKAEAKILPTGENLIEVTDLEGKKFHLNPAAVRQVHTRADGGSTLLMVDGTSLLVEEQVSPPEPPLSKEEQEKADQEKADKEAAEAAVQYAKDTAAPTPTPEEQKAAEEAAKKEAGKAAAPASPAGAPAAAAPAPGAKAPTHAKA